MTAMVHEFPSASGDQRLVAEAPALPIEGHIVAAALAAERLRSVAFQIMLILQHAPRNAATVVQLHADALTAWCAIDEHYRAYQAVLECRGQG